MSFYFDKENDAVLLSYSKNIKYIVDAEDQFLKRISKIFNEIKSEYSSEKWLLYTSLSGIKDASVEQKLKKNKTKKLDAEIDETLQEFASDRIKEHSITFNKGKLNIGISFLNYDHSGNLGQYKFVCWIATKDDKDEETLKRIKDYYAENKKNNLTFVSIPGWIEWLETSEAVTLDKLTVKVVKENVKNLINHMNKII